MKVLITGGSGYIGVRVLRLLQAQGHQIVVASRRPPGTNSLWLSFNLEAPTELNLPAPALGQSHLDPNLVRLAPTYRPPRPCHWDDDAQERPRRDMW